MSALFYCLKLRSFANLPCYDLLLLWPHGCLDVCINLASTILRKNLRSSCA